MIRTIRRWHYRRAIKVMVRDPWKATDFDHMNIILLDIRYTRSKLDRLL